MWRVVVRGFFARRLRAILTGIAIALGVALMAGTYILTDTINSSFANIFNSAARGRSVVVVPHQGLGSTANVQTATVSQAVLDRVKAVPGVAQAAGEVFTAASLFADGKRLNKRAPSFVGSTLPPRFENFSAVSGHLPNRARRGRDRPGDRPALLAEGRPDAARRRREHGGHLPHRRDRQVRGQRVLRRRRRGRADARPGTPRRRRAVVIRRGHRRGRAVDQRQGAAERGSARCCPTRSTCAPASRRPPSRPRTFRSQLGFLRTFLLIFAYVALFVGAFIIFNTFSITVAQRTREFGLLRMLGATRGQILRSVVAEGVMLGLLGIGRRLLAGLGLAPALDQLFKAFGADLPDSGTVVEARTVWVSLLAGTLVTVLAGLLPALRASRVTPIAALREGVSLHEKATRSQRRRRIGIAVDRHRSCSPAWSRSASSGAGVVTIIVIVGLVVALRVPRVRRRIGKGFSSVIVGARPRARRACSPGAASPAASRATTRSATPGARP